MYEAQVTSNNKYLLENILPFITLLQRLKIYIYGRKRMYFYKKRDPKHSVQEMKKKWFKDLSAYLGFKHLITDFFVATILPNQISPQDEPNSICSVFSTIFSHT